MSINTISSSLASQAIHQPQPAQQAQASKAREEATESAAEKAREGGGQATSLPVDPSKGRNVNTVA